MAANDSPGDGLMKKKDTASALTLIFGSVIVFLLTVWGMGQLLGMFWYGPTVAMCNGEPMSQGEQCQVSIEASSTTHTYGQQLHDQWLEYDVYRYGVSLVIVGALAFVIVHYIYSRPVRKRS